MVAELFALFGILFWLAIGIWYWIREKHLRERVWRVEKQVKYLESKLREHDEK